MLESELGLALAASSRAEAAHGAELAKARSLERTQACTARFAQQKSAHHKSAFREATTQYH
jgi:hypothetical protein